MKREFRHKYLPNYYGQDIFIKLHNLQQRDMSVEKYAVEFEQLMIKCDLNEPEEHTIAKFLKGLKIEIANIVQL